jgi:plastocyanin
MTPLRTYLFVLAALGPIICAANSISGRVSGPDGKGIAQAVIFVQDSSAASARRANSAAPSATMDQVDKTFVPELLPIVVGTRVRFPNHDQIHHHVYSFSPAKNFELPLYRGEEAPTVLFDKVGVIKVGCNIHDWMSAIILVLPTQYFAVTDQDGRFVLTGLRGNTYTLAAWHALSKLKPQETEQEVAVRADVADLSFTLPLAPARPRPAVHGVRGEP